MNQHIPLQSTPGPARQHGARRVVLITISLLVLVGSLLAYGFGSAAPSTANDGPLPFWPGAQPASAPGQGASPNGGLTAAELTGIGSGLQLRNTAAKDFKRLAAGLKAAGHRVQVNSAYRTRAEQQSLVAELGLLSEGGKAAPVGESEHGLGISVDMTLDAQALAWMNENAPGYGFERTVAGEPWHWTHTAGS